MVGFLPCLELFDALPSLPSALDAPGHERSTSSVLPHSAFECQGESTATWQISARATLTTKMEEDNLSFVV